MRTLSTGYSISQGIALRHPTSALVVAPLLVAFLWCAFNSFAEEKLSELLLFFITYALGLLVTFHVAGRNSSDRRYCLKLFSLAYGINVIFIFLFTAYFVEKTGQPFIPSQGMEISDEIRYFASAEKLARQWASGAGNFMIDPLEGYKYLGYSWLLAGINYISQQVGDSSVLSPKLANAMFGGLIIVLTYRVGTIVYDRRVGYLAALLALLFPVWIYYSAVLLRDIAVAFFVSLFVYEVLAIMERGNGKVIPILATLFSGLCLYYLRSPTFYVVFLGSAIFVLLNIKNQPLRYLSIAALVISYVVLALSGTVYGEHLMREMLDQADRWGAWRSAVSNPQSLAVRYIYQAPGFAFVPLIILYTAAMPVPPIQGFMLHHYFMGIGVVSWYFYMPFWAYGMLKSYKNKKALYLTLVTLLIFAGIAIIQPDIRHKTQFLSFGLIQTAYAMIALRRQRNGILISVGCIGLLLFSLYLFLKL